MLFLSAQVGGCAGPPVDNGGNTGDGGGGNGGGGDAIALSTASLKIGEFLAIRHSSIVAGEARMISLRQMDSMTQQHEVIAHADGELALAMPPYFDPDAASLAGGTFSVSLDGVDGEESVVVEDLYELPGVETGAVIQIFINSTLADIDSTLARLDADTGAFDVDSERESFRAALLANKEFFEGLMAEWDTNQTLTFPTSESETVIVQPDQVREAERYLANMILGAHSELLRRDASPNARILGSNCIGSGLEGGELTACLQQCVDDVKNSALQASQSAGVLPTVVGAGITIFGLFVASKGVILTGVVVTTVGAVHGFVTAYAADENTDTFGQNDGEGFSAARETVSQLTRYGANIVSAPATLALNAKDLSSALESAKCQENNGNQRVLGGPTDGQFCEIVLDDILQNLNTNITGLGAVSASSQFSSDFRVASAVDGNSFSSWFSNGGSASDDTEVFTWQLIESGEVFISRVETDPEQFEGGGDFGFDRGTLLILDINGQTVFSQDYAFPADRVEINQSIPEGTQGRTVQLILVDHQDTACGGFAELRIFGRPL